MPNGSHFPQVTCARHRCGTEWINLPCIAFQCYWKLLSDEEGEQQKPDLSSLCHLIESGGAFWSFFSFFTLSMLPSISPSHTSNFSQSLFKDSLLCLSISLIPSTALLFLQYLFWKCRTGRTQETIQNPSASILKLVCSFRPLTAADAHIFDGWKPPTDNVATIRCGPAYTFVSLWSSKRFSTHQLCMWLK